MSLIQPASADPAPAVAAVDPVVVAEPAVVAPVVADTTAALSIPAVVADPVAATAAPVRPEGVPDAYWDDATGVKTTEAVARLTELEAAETARKADVPADASGYKLEPSEPILDPTTGKAISFNAEDPLAKAAVAWAHENGVGQAGLSKLLGAFAQNEMAALKTHNEFVAAETAKLGENSAARFTAVSSGLAQHAGVDGAKAIMASLGSADAVIAMEKVLKAVAGPAIGSPPAATTKSSLDGLSGVDLLSATLK